MSQNVVLFQMYTDNQSTMVRQKMNDKAVKEMTDDEWFAAIAGTDDKGQSTSLFPLPDPKVQVSSVGNSGTPVLESAFQFWQFTRDLLNSHGNGLSDDSVILDFGCAWARILRFWLRDIPPSQVYGFDIEERFLSLAKEQVPGCKYSLIQSSPPLGVSDNTFDLIYAFSVFSHLPEGLTNQWIKEFARVLKPGGIACITTRPRAHIEIAGTEAAKTDHSSLYARVITDKEAALQRYDAGEFVFYPSDGGGGLVEATYGEAIIPRAYAEANWTDLELVNFYENYSRTYLQPCFVLRKAG